MTRSGGVCDSWTLKLMICKIQNIQTSSLLLLFCSSLEIFVSDAKIASMWYSFSLLSVFQDFGSEDERRINQR